MKKLSLVYLLFFVSMIVLAGCGDEYREANTAADGAVSSGAVSGAAVETERIPVKYANRNSTNLYTSTGQEYSKTIMQRNLDGELVKKLKPETRGADIISMRYVDDEWMYYTRWKEGTTSSSELWRAPIQKKDGCDDVQFEQEEKVLVSEGGIFDDIYVADDFVYYNEVSAPAQEGTCRRYDMKNDRQVTMPAGAPVQEGAGSVWCGYCDGSMFLVRDGELAADGKGGLYVQDIHTNQFQLLEKDADEDGFWGFVTNEKQAYYLAGNEVKRYCSGMKQAETYITEEQLVKAEEAAGYPAFSLEICALYLDDTTLYILAKEKEREFPDMVFSCKLQGKCEVKFEDKLFAGVENGHFEGQLMIERIVDGECLLHRWADDESDGLVCFDLATGEEKEVTKKDAEYWWQYW